MTSSPDERTAGSLSPDGKRGRQIPGDRVRHSPSLRSDQEGATELPGWWQWCHSRVPCLTLCGPDAACRRGGGGRGSQGSVPGTAGVTGGCPCCSPWCWWLSHIHPPRSPQQEQAHRTMKALVPGTGVLSPFYPSPRGWGLCTNPRCPRPPNPPSSPAWASPGCTNGFNQCPKRDKASGQPAAPSPGGAVGEKVTPWLLFPFLPSPFPLPPT